MGMSDGVSLMARSTCSESSMLMYLDMGNPRRLSASCLCIMVMSRDERRSSNCLIKRILMASKRACLSMGIRANPKNIKNQKRLIKEDIEKTPRRHAIIEAASRAKTRPIGLPSVSSTGGSVNPLRIHAGERKFAVDGYRPRPAGPPRSNYVYLLSAFKFLGSGARRLDIVYLSRYYTLIQYLGG